VAMPPIGGTRISPPETDRKAFISGFGLGFGHYAHTAKPTQRD
jgi:hypothetical protein